MTQLTEHLFVNLAVVAMVRFEQDMSGNLLARVTTQWGYTLDLYGDDALRLRQEVELLAETDGCDDDLVTLASLSDRKEG